MNYGFQSAFVDIRTSNGRDDILLSPMDFVDSKGVLHRAPIGTSTDGLSAPALVQNLFPAVGDISWEPAVMHDAGYRNFLQIQINGEWVLANYTQEQCDDLLLDAMIANGVSKTKRELIYKMLRAFGHIDFAMDRASAGLK